MNKMNNIYKNNIYERYKDLKNLNKIDFDNNDLWKIFEYYSCIKLTEEYGIQFYEYNDIDPDFKEINKMSRNDMTYIIQFLYYTASYLSYYTAYIIYQLIW